MKTTYTFLLIILTSWCLEAQILRAPADMVISCELGNTLDPDSFHLKDHPVFGTIHMDSNLVDSIITNDIVCAQFCNEDERIFYLNDLSVFDLACGYYQDLDNGDYDEQFSLYWGMEGYAVGFDSIQIIIADPPVGQPERKERNRIRRVIRGFLDGKVHSQDTQSIYIVYCNPFRVNLNDFWDTTDCVDFSDFDSVVYVFMDRPIDTFEMRDSFIVPESCGECGLVAVDYDDETLYWNGKNFLIIKRYWSIIDHNIYDPFNMFHDGRWDFCQTIYVFFSDGNLHGQLYYDKDENCQLDSAEYGLRNWRVYATSSTDTFQTLTDYNGGYVLPLTFGDYEITAVPPNRAWSTCQQSWNITLDSLNPLDTLMIGAMSDTLCVDARVEVEAIHLEYCADNRYNLEVGNNGTEAVVDAELTIELPSFFTMTDASVPFTNTSGSSYLLEIGDLGIGEWQPHYLDVSMDCDSVDLGDVVCVRAEINPTDSCGLDRYRGPIIEASSVCDGDSVKLILKNVGQDMKTTLDFWVVEDDLILFMNVIELDSNEEKTISRYAEGATYHIVCEQDPSFPSDPFVVSGIQDCNALGGESSKGILNHIGVNSPYENIDYNCAEVEGGIREVSKKAFPVGSGPDHEIRRDQKIEYTITFANRTDDTIRKVRIQDFLDASIQLNSIEVLSASHPYSLSVMGIDTSPFHGIEFYFDDIILPDSASDPFGSRGFIKFSVVPDPDISNGDSLINRAEVFFDQKRGIETEVVFHTISGFLTSSYDFSDHQLESPLLFWPNPVSELSFIELDGRYFDRTYQVELLDITGRILMQAYSHTPKTSLHWWSKLAPGSYLIRVRTDRGEILAQTVIKM